VPESLFVTSDDLVKDGLQDAVRALGRQVKNDTAALEARTARELRKAGFDKLTSAALGPVLPLSAIRNSLTRKPLRRFFDQAEAAAHRLARSNVHPSEVVRALRIAEDVLSRAFGGDASAATTREQLAFCTILVVNQGYHAVREAESGAFQDLFCIELEASNTDVLLRKFLETMAISCGADAAHLYMCTADPAVWELRASTARAASAETLAVVRAPAGLRKALGRVNYSTNGRNVMDAGWEKRFPYVWSFPLSGDGVVQFGFARERTLLARELEMLSVAADRCHSGAQKTRLLEEIAQREERLSKLAIRMLMVEENERRRISRELHDDAGQSLVVIRLQMELIEQSLPENTEARERLAEARDLTEKTILDLRRLIADLSPAVLEQLGLGAAVRQMANRFRARYPSDVRVDVGHLPQLDPNFQLVIYRLAQECLNNISQHSKASTVNISVSVADNVLGLQIEDNGTGFDVEQALERKESFGLTGMRERVDVLGGNFSVSSTRKQGQVLGGRKRTGTVVRIELPIPREKSS
jgi:signal transduction histidine kinase